MIAVNPLFHCHFLRQGRAQRCVDAQEWLHHGLAQAGLHVVLMETRQVKGALKAMPMKTDRRDAEGIARVLHLGWFGPVHCNSVSAQEVRAALGARKAVQQSMIALELSIRVLLWKLGLKVGTIPRGRFEQRIHELAAGNPVLEAATVPMLRAWACLRQELAGLERRVRNLAQDALVCRRRMSMPGIGAVVAPTYRSAIDESSCPLHVLEEGWAMGRPHAAAKPIRRTRCLWRDN